MRIQGACCAALIAAVLVLPSVRVVTASRQGAPPAPSVSRPSGSDDAPVRVDAVVTDNRGRPVPGLRAADFELLEDGAPRPFSGVEYRLLAGADAGAPAPIATQADEERAARQPGTRVFAFLLDEFHVTPGENASRAREAVSRFIDEQLQPQDLALVLRPLDPLTTLRFTRDRAALQASLAGFTGRKGDLTPRSRFEEEYIGRAPAAVVAARAQIVAAALRELTMRLGDMQADRGVVVLVSEGLREPGGARVPRAQDLQGVVRAASHFHLSIYTCNPGAPPPEDARSPSGEPAAGTLEWLAQQTGGRAVPPGGDLVAGLSLMSRDLAAYYAITYSGQADGKFHRVEIRAKRHDVAVRSRPGYWAALGGEWRALLAASAVLPVSTRALHRSSVIDTWVGLASDSAGRARMVVTWEPRPGSAASPEAVVVHARTSAGQDLFNGQVTAVRSGDGRQADSARFEVPAGRVELDMSIVDMQGKVLDTELRDFDVPDLRAQKRGPMLLFPEVVRTRTLRDFRAAATDPDAAPSSGRVFARSDRLLIRVPTYDPSGMAVQVSARILNERGDRMRDIDREGGAPGDDVAQFALPLYWLGPGQYMIELAGVNANGAVRERLAFRVRG
jgi:VWFA-related protein